jgi:hypothetical protein
MKKILVLALILFGISNLSFGQELYHLQTQYYLYTNGLTNAYSAEDETFEIQCDDGSNYYYSIWAETNITIPQFSDLPSTNSAIAWEEEMWQQSKPYMLKYIENVYVDFLTNTWTLTCRSAGLIPTNYTVTVDNTDEATNVGLLLTIRPYDFNTYDKMAGEFDRLKAAIVGTGGIMAKVRKHNL